MRDFDTPNRLSKGHFTYAKFAKLKELAKNTIGESNEVFEIELHTLISLYNEIDSKINSIDKQISTIIKELNPPTLSIPGIGELTTAVIISEYGDFFALRHHWNSRSWRPSFATRFSRCS
jgi:transposase